MAKVEDLIVGSDGCVRGAVVRVSPKGNLLRRPLQRLYPLEIHHHVEDSNDEGDERDEATANIDTEEHDPDMYVDQLEWLLAAG